MTPVLFSNSLVIFLVTLGLTGVVAPLAILLSKKIHLVDVPGSLPHHTHARTTPLSGGLILAATFVIAATIFNLWKIPGVLTVFLASMIIFAFGIWDDLKGLNAPLKFLGQIAATTVLVVSGIRVQFLESPQIYLGGPLALYTALDVLITYLWVVGITNAFNLIDSMDGIAVGLALSGLISYAIGTAMSEQTNLMMVCMVLVGITGVLFAINSAPARTFLGDSGAQTLGFVLSVISIVFSPKDQYQASSWFLPILIVGVPIFDTFLVIYARLKTRKPVFNASLDHLYHRLTRVGFSTNRTVIVINGAAILLDCVAFIALTQTPVIANILFGLCLIAGAAGIILLGSDAAVKRGNQWMKKHIQGQETNDRI
jgi:UDP-GlcNAc:undecaprenyl-phosphate GlcNAc-1-phosphate transferase